MKTIRNLALAAAAAGALAAGSAALAQDAKKEEPKADARTDAQHAHGKHRGHGMGGMKAMQERCHAEPAKSGEQEHKH